MKWVLTVETNDLDLNTSAGNQALLERLMLATERVPLRALRATLASMAHSQIPPWKTASRGRCVHSLLTICQKRAGVANNVRHP